MGHLYMFRMFRNPVSVLDEKSNKTIKFQIHLEEYAPGSSLEHGQTCGEVSLTFIS